MRRAGLLLACALALAACDPEPACDPGQREDTGSCLSAPGSGGSTDAGASHGSAGDGAASDDDAGGESDAGGGGACQPGPGHYDGFGDACTKDSECGCLAPTCATPGLEYCSRLQCQGDADACPPGWTCTDITAFSMDPKVTHMCVKN